MPASLRTRLAPTPSGALHIGNLANFLLIERLAQAEQGTVRLRIDDCDATRARPEFVEHIFETLRWLGIEWQEGPRDAAEFARDFSQSARKGYYFSCLEALRASTYACECSRKEISGAYRGRCREKALVFEPGKHALRVRIDEPALAAELGDVVLWRKDGGPAYQWASVIDDLDQRINLIVRGDDLRSSSELQKYLAKLVTPSGFDGVRFLHHPLLTDEQGRKLSKSQGAASVTAARRAGLTPEELRAQLAPVLEAWGY